MIKTILGTKSFKLFTMGGKHYVTKQGSYAKAISESEVIEILTKEYKKKDKQL